MSSALLFVAGPCRAAEAGPVLPVVPGQLGPALSPGRPLNSILEPRVTVQTSMGDIELELNSGLAPVTTSNFLRYAEAGFYRDGSFHRTVTAKNQPTNAIKIAVIQASAPINREPDAFPPIPLERTRDTRLKHTNGTVSMARLGPNTARHSFFICIDPQPELDFGGRRNPDGQGFAAFGTVIRGMDVVRRIHASPAVGQDLTPPIRIRQVIRSR